MKLLDNKAFEIIKAARAEGKDYSEIAKTITDAGYITRRGNKISAPELSKFACSKGLRSVAKYKKRKLKSKPTKVETDAQNSIDNLVLNVMGDVGLTKSTKLKLMKVLLNEE